MSEIKFGTDGWRGITDKDFNDENVIKASRATAKYVYDNFGADKKIIIGFDPRRKADYFAKLCADVFKTAGFKVYLADKITATPVLAYSALYENACAIMFTASHNPPEYSGMKFIPDYAGPATSEITKEITDNLDKNFISRPGGNITLHSFDEVYEKHIESLIDLQKIYDSGIHINYDALHGAAGNLFMKILNKHKIPCSAENLNYDINFGGKLPEPAEKFLTDLKEKCKTDKIIGFSNDGDGDRFALIDETGSFVSANEVIAILLKHLIINKHLTGKLVKTVAGSKMLEIYAQKVGTEVIETPVGFKHVGKALRENDVIIGGEESGGLTIKGHIPEKDGILANLLIAEAKAMFEKNISEMRADLKAEVGCEFINARRDLKLANEKEATDVMNKISQNTEFAGLTVIGKNTSDGVKLYLSDNCSGILIRKSGTEPLLRIYFESNSQAAIESLKTAVEKITEQ